MLLTKRTRQKYLKELGFYNGKIDGIIGEKTKAAYKKLQKKYFKRSKDRDGVYGTNTDILLRNAYKVHKHCKNFTLDEFECGCGGKHCTGYPAELSTYLLKNMQSIRSKYGAATITSGLRCKQYNKELDGSSTTSLHMRGRALDFAILPMTNNLVNRRKIMAFIKKLPKYRYTYCDEGGNYPNMGNAIHFDVK